MHVYDSSIDYIMTLINNFFYLHSRNNNPKDVKISSCINFRLSGQGRGLYLCHPVDVSSSGKIRHWWDCIRHVSRKSNLSVVHPLRGIKYLWPISWR